MPMLRLDYIWHDDHFRALNAEKGPSGLGSDHLPVVADLELLVEEDGASGNE